MSTKEDILQILQESTEFEMNVPLRKKLLSEAEGGNEWAQLVINLVVDRGTLLQQLDRCYVILGMMWPRVAHKEEFAGEPPLYTFEVDLIDDVHADSAIEALFWFLADAGLLINPLNHASTEGLNGIKRDPVTPKPGGGPDIQLPGVPATPGP